MRFEHLLDSLDQPSRKWVEERDTKNPAVTLWMILTGEEGEMLKGRYFKFCHGECGGELRMWWDRLDGDSSRQDL